MSAYHRNSLDAVKLDHIEVAIIHLEKLLTLELKELDYISISDMIDNLSERYLLTLNSGI